MENKIKLLEYFELKGKNKRIRIELCKDNEKFFVVQTKTLQDFKTRNITTTLNVYSVETFAVLAGVMFEFLEHSVVKNKHLLKEISAIQKWNAWSSLKF